MKVDASGDTLWTRRYSKGAWTFPEASGAEACSDGGYVIVGSIHDPTCEQVFVVRTDAEGDTLWTLAYTDESRLDSRGHAIREMDSGGFVVIGETTFDIDPYRARLLVVEILFMKIGPNGALWSTRSLPGPPGSVPCSRGAYGYDIQPTGDGRYMIVGSYWVMGPFESGDYVAKLSSSGTEMWGVAYSSGGAYKLGATSLLVTGDNSCVLPRGQDGDAVLQWVGSGGCVRGRTAYGGEGSDYFERVISTPDGDLAAVGTSTSYGDGSNDIYLVKIEGDALAVSPGGSECDPLVAGGGGSDQVFELPPLPFPGVECPPGTWLLCGSMSPGDCRCITHLDPPYVERFLYTLGDQSIADSVAYGGVIVPTGFSGVDIYTSAGDTLIDVGAGFAVEFSPRVTSFVVEDLPLNLDLATFEGDEFPLGIWFTNPLGVPVSARVRALEEGTGVEGVDARARGLSLSAPIPNPAAGELSFSVVVDEAGPVSIRVVNVAGRIVRTLHTGELPPGRHRFAWDLAESGGGQVASGVYFIVAEGAERRLRKTVVIR